jgi:hypothetical protein
VKRYIDNVIMLCIEIKTNSRANSEWAQCIAQHINIRWSWKATGTYTLWALR